MILSKKKILKRYIRTNGEVLETSWVTWHGPNSSLVPEDLRSSVFNHKGKVEVNRSAPKTIHNSFLSKGEMIPDGI